MLLLKEKLCLFFLCLFPFAAFSQTDSSVYKSAIQNALATSHSLQNAGEEIYTGAEHVGYRPFSNGIPYFETGQWHKGSIVYRGVQYNDVFLKYDLLADEVIVRHLNGFSPLTLFSNRISWFTLDNNRFVWLQPKDTLSVPPAGLYQQLVAGPLTLYARRWKLVEETTTSTEVLRNVIDKSAFYVERQGEFYLIPNEDAIMNLVNDKKGQVKSMLKAEHLKYRKNKEEVIARIVQYYNQLSK
jgi:hypothetical protein